MIFLFDIYYGIINKKLNSKTCSDQIWGKGIITMFGKGHIEAKR